MRSLLKFAALVCVVASAAHGQRRNDSWLELLPPGNAQGAVVVSCNGCHSLKVVVHARRSAQEWSATVNDMIQRGAPVYPEEIGLMAAYLAKSFSKATPRLVNVNTASRQDLEKLPGVNAEIAGKIEARQKTASLRTAEDLRRALGLENAEFAKIRYFFKYTD